MSFPLGIGMGANLSSMTPRPQVGGILAQRDRSSLLSNARRREECRFPGHPLRPDNARAQDRKPWSLQKTGRHFRFNGSENVKIILQHIYAVKTVVKNLYIKILLFL
jgi:hypothetical protein